MSKTTSTTEQGIRVHPCSSVVDKPELGSQKFIVRYGGAAVKFIENVSQRVYELVADDEASTFPTEALANQYIGKFHLNTNAFVEEVKP